MDFIEPFTYPFKDLKKLIIGGMLIFPGSFLPYILGLLISIILYNWSTDATVLVPIGMFLLFISFIFLGGYVVKVAGDTVWNKNELPGFDPIDLILKGFGNLLLYIIYSIILLLLLSPFLILFHFFENTDWATLIGITTFFALIFLDFFIIIIFMIALVRYGEKENIFAAYEFKEILMNFKTNLLNYLIAGVIICVPLTISFFVFFAMIFTVIGILFIGILVFYYLLVSTRMFAQIYKESKEKLNNQNNSFTNPNDIQNQK